MIPEILSRRSIRKYQPQPPSPEQLAEIIEAARLAPSGSNSQPWQFVIVTNAEKRRQLATLCHGQQWMAEAPVHLVCVADAGVRLKDPNLTLDEESPQKGLKMVIRDTAIAVTHVLLAATNLGLGSCWVGLFEQAALRPALGIPADKYVLGIVTLGYAAESPAAHPRKAAAELVHQEQW